MLTSNTLLRSGTPWSTTRSADGYYMGSSFLICVVSLPTQAQTSLHIFGRVLKAEDQKPKLSLKLNLMGPLGGLGLVHFIHFLMNHPYRIWSHWLRSKAVVFNTCHLIRL